MQYLTTPTAQALSWALLHSLWQGVLIMFALMLTLRCIPTRYSRIRYNLALTALLGVVVAAAVTFTVRLALPSPATPVGQTSIYQLAAYHPTVEQTTAALQSTWIDLVNCWVNANVPLVLILWCIGAVIFSLRITAGWFYVNTLRRKAGTLDDTWQQYIQTLAAQLQVNRLVQVAESGLVQAPVVLGYLKPIILLPIGMIGGLTTEQIETILIHELVHIRRHDYIINLIQSFVEAIFFFNPCVWFISQQIRNEREHCCDDAVVSVKGSPKQYIHALAMLEEVRLSKAGLALSLAENKNVLLNRIKRMMEKTAKKHSGRERIVPAVLLVVGLLCASWITMTSPAARDHKPAIVPGVKSDTTIKKTEKTSRRSRTTITTTDENGKVHRETKEEYDGDEPVHLDMDFDYSFEIPPVPEIPPIPEIPGFPDIAMPEMPFMPPMPDIAFAYAPFADSLMAMQMNINIDEEKMAAFNINMEKWNKDMAKWNESMEEWNAEHGERLKEMGEKMKEWEEENSEILQKIEKQSKEIEANVHAFQQELQKQLVSDGYLKRDEEVESMHWDNDNIEINGTRIKEEHKAKYRKLHSKYFKTNNGQMIFKK
jgi:beta-lactamase regulating signal transducer with metallopeptidase domain